MTWALCLNCGETKFGAILRCEKCGFRSTGDMNLDTLFSDHNISVSTLIQFGEVIKAINLASADAQERFWTFIYYVSVHHPELIERKIEEDEVSRYKKILQIAHPPRVILTRGDDHLEDLIQ